MGKAIGLIDGAQRRQGRAGAATERSLPRPTGLHHRTPIGHLTIAAPNESDEGGSKIYEDV